MNRQSFLCLVFCCAILSSSAAKRPLYETVSLFDSNNYLVRTIEEFNERAKDLKPGDELILANGIWKDAELVINGHGTANNPIKLTAQEKGKVFLEGQSGLKIAGSHIHVEGLVFRNGYTPFRAVIEFRENENQLCNNCRVTECVIDDYNPPGRFDSDSWVAIYGKNNRLDHCYLVGKRNKGVTVAVRLKSEASRENYHRIDHNHFGYHPTLGSNGGETLRIGTSHHSLSNSKTTVEDNYFEHCNGELEIISNKSCQNSFVNNTFFECQGTLTMRHGHETLVDNNYFFGNGKAHTGGIRIINESQTVTNNYLEGITGYRFRGALVVMNGVPNSPLNRYSQVKNSKAENNLIIDSDYIQLCAGSDEERSATPINSSISNNIIYNTKRDELFTVYDDISGITFLDNILSKNIAGPTNNSQAVEGFSHEALKFINKDGIKRSLKYPHIGPNTDRPRPDDTNTGVTWYPKQDYHINFSTGNVIEVEPGENTIWDAVNASNEGDVLLLVQSGKYHSTKEITIPHTLTIKSNGAFKPVLTFESPSLIKLENGGSLTIEGLKISGTKCNSNSANSVITTSELSMINNYKLMVRSCDVEDLNVNEKFNFLRVYKNTFADSILLHNCNFKNVTGHILNLDKETDDRGIYNVENVVVEQCSFTDIGGSAIKLYRGGKDESTFGPTLKLARSNFYNVGHDESNKNEAAIHLHGVQYAEIENVDIDNSRKIHLHLIVGEPVIKLKDIKLTNSEEMYSNSKAYSSDNIVVQN